MEILSYIPEMSPELTASYNKLIHGLPHCYPISVDDFASVASAIKAGKSHKLLSQEAAFVVREGKSITGFVHVAVENPKKAGEASQGIIPFLWYDKGHRPAGQALLESAEEYLRQRNLSQITAFHQDYRYDFYHIAHAYMSDRLAHIYGLMGINGYKRFNGEVYLDWPEYEPIEPAPLDVALKISAEWKQEDSKHPDLLIRAYQDEKEVGVCESISCGEFTDADDAQDWMLTVWLWVSEEIRGRGVGRHLLRRALQEARKGGYRNAVISTNWQNFPALLFYSNFGYHVADWTYSVQRNLE